ncbi:MAG: hypothetical protein H6604_05650 [Flavobacteriales bacterium]|nr:hypothetical protein [Flavobacteriales bacterium]
MILRTYINYSLLMLVFLFPIEGIYSTSMSHNDCSTHTCSSLEKEKSDCHGSSKHQKEKHSCNHSCCIHKTISNIVIPKSENYKPIKNSKLLTKHSFYYKNKKLKELSYSLFTPPKIEI